MKNLILYESKNKLIQPVTSCDGRLTCEDGQHHSAHNVMNEDGEEEVVVVENSVTLISCLKPQTAQHEPGQHVHDQSHVSQGLRHHIQSHNYLSKFYTVP